MDFEDFRTVTGKSTIPLGTAGNGVITTVAGTNDSILQITGGVLADFEKWNNGHREVWIYGVDEHKVAKMTGFQTLDATTFLIYLDRPIASLLNSTYTIIIGDLIAWSAKNNGTAPSNADAEVDGTALKAGDAINKKEIHKPGNGLAVYRDVITVDGTGTSLVIEEIR